MNFKLFLFVLASLTYQKICFSQTITATPAVTHVSCVNGTNGSVKLNNTTGGTAPYTYTWQPGNTNGNIISSKAIGNYTVTIKGTGATTNTYSYSIGYKTLWQNFNGEMTTNSTGDTLKRTGTSSSWLRRADGANVLEASTDGWVEYVAVSNTIHKMFGLYDVGSGAGFEHMDFGIYLRADGDLRKINNGVEVSIGTYTIGDIIRIERLGSNIYYKKNGVVLNTISISASMVASRLMVRAALYSPNTRLENLGCSFPVYINAGLPQIFSCSTPTNAILTGSTTVIGGTYTWSPGGSAPNSLTTTVTTAGVYTLSITTPTFGCIATSTVLVTKTPNVIVSSSAHASAINCDGTNDYIDPNLVVTTFSNNFTYEAWVKPTATHEIDAEATSGITGISGQRFLVWPTWRTDGVTLGVSVGTNGVSVYEHGSNYMPPLLVWQGTITNWTHIAVTYTNKTPKLYVNGVLVRTGLTSPQATCYPALGAGNYYSGSQFGGIGGGYYGMYQGEADEFRLWSTVRSQEQIQANLGNEYSSTGDGLEAYYKFNHGIASGNNTGISTATDYSGNNRTGTLVNFALMGSSSNWISPGAVSVKSSTICAGTSLTLTASGTNSYSWNTGATTNSIVVSPGTNTNYTVTGTTSGCTSSSTFSAIVNALPTPTASTTGTLTCSTTTVALNGGPSSGVTYTWTGAGFSGGTNSQNAVATAAGTYTLKVTNATTGCTNSATTAVTQNTVLPNISVGSNQTITCTNPTVTLTGSSTTPGVTYSWTPGGETPMFPTTSVSSAGTYTLKVTNPVNGCVSSGTIAVIGNLLVNANITDYVNDTIKGSVNLCVVGGVPPYNIAWNGSKLPTAIVAYHNLLDSFPGVMVDSVKFKNLVDSLRQRTSYTDLEPGTYSVTVYDSANDSINLVAFVGANITWFNTGSEIISEEPLAKLFGDVNYFYGPVKRIDQTGEMGDESNFAISLTSINIIDKSLLIFSIPNNRDIIFAGLCEKKFELNGSKDDLLGNAAFTFNGDETFNVYFKNEPLVSGIEFNSGDMFSLRTDPVSGKILFYKNEALIAQADYENMLSEGNSEFLPKIVFGNEGASLRTFKGFGNIMDKGPSISGAIKDVTCDNICSGEITATAISAMISTPLSYQIFKLGSSTPLNTINISGQNSATFNNLCPGKYTVKYNYQVIFSPTSSSVSKNFEVVYKPNWTNVTSNVSVNSIDNSLQKNSAGGTFAFDAGASSFNTLSSTSPSMEWVEWGSTGSNVLGLSSSDLDLNFNSINYGVLTFELFGIKMYLVLNNGVFVAGGTYLTNDKFKIEKNGANVVVKVKNLIVHTFSSISPNNNLVVDASIWNPLSTIKNPRISFDCNLPKVYAQLKKELDGTYYQTYNNELLFTTDGDYSNANISYSIYNYNRTPQPGLTINSSTLKNGDNRFQIDITSLVSGFYILELKNQKQEKLLLRFKK